MPMPKLAVGPVSDPSAPMRMGAPPEPCEATSAHDSTPPPAAGLAAAAPAGAVAPAAGLGASVGLAAGAPEVQAAAASASAPRRVNSGRVIRRNPPLGEASATIPHLPGTL